MIGLLAGAMSACGDKKPKAPSDPATPMSDADKAVDDAKRAAGKAGDALKDAFKAGGEAIEKKAQEAKVAVEKKADEISKDTEGFRKAAAE